MNFPIISALILFPTIGSIFLFFSKDNSENTNVLLEKNSHPNIFKISKKEDKNLSKFHK